MLTNRKITIGINVYAMILFFITLTFANDRTSDSLSLVAIHNANPDIGWDFATPIDSWSNVTVENDRVTELKFYGTDSIKVLPPEIGNLSALVHFRLTKSLVTSLPNEFGNLTSLEILELLELDSLVQFPSVIFNFTSLKELELYRCVFTEIPAEIKELTALQKLQLDELLYVTTLPAEIGSLSQLLILELDLENLEVVPSEIGNLSSLVTLNFFDLGKTAVIPAEIGNLTSLQELTFQRGDQISTLPAEIGNLTSLQLLKIENLFSLTQLPPEIENLTSLKNLELWNLSGLTELPAEISNLDSLTHLELLGCSVPEIPERMLQLPSLTYLSIENCSGISTLPASLETLQNLTFLYLTDLPRLTSLPQEFGNLSSLKKVIVNGLPAFTSLPVEIGNLSSLEIIHFTNSGLTSLPDEMSNISTLTAINVDTCQITELPVSLASMPSLTDLIIRKNNLHFDDLEPFENVSYNARYASQNKIGTPQTLVSIGGAAVDLCLSVGGSQNNYQWKKDGVDFVTGSDTIDVDAAAVYHCVITSDSVDGVTLESETFTVIEGTQRTVDSLALVAILNANPDLPWNTTDPIDTWEGVVVEGGTVEEIAFTDRRITDFPVEVAGFRSLSSIILNGGGMTTFPSGIQNFTHLDYLEILNLPLVTTFPVEICALDYMSYLSIINCGFESLPSEIGNFTGLGDLVLKELPALTTLPSEIGNLTDLGSLELRGLPALTSLPAEIGNCTFIMEMWIDSCGITTLPSEIGLWEELEYLELKNLPLESFPVSFGNLTFLRTLYMENLDSLLTLPNEFGNLESLEFLKMLGLESFTTLPASIGNLRNLNEFNMTDIPNIITLPPELGDCGFLAELQLKSLGLKTLPAELGNATNITTLTIENCDSLSSIPQELGNLSNLNTLTINNAKLETIPEWIGMFDALEYLDVSCNGISVIPDTIVSLTQSPNSLININVAGNMLQFDDLELLQNDGVTLIATPQNKIGAPQTLKVDTVDGDAVDLCLAVGGSQNHYQWKKDGIDFVSGNDTIDVSAPGVYHCVITSDSLPGDTLESALFTVEAWNTRPMTLVFYTQATGATGLTVTLPLYDTVDVWVDWGDGSNLQPFTTEGVKKYTYATHGIYTVKVYGKLTHFGMYNCPNIKKLVAVTSFGDLGIKSLKYGFHQAKNLIEVPTTLPASVTSLRSTFDYAASFNGDLSGWDVSNVTDMGYTFYDAEVFNGDISGWDVSNVTTMIGMFGDAYKFNQDISGWDVSSVTDMSEMFVECEVFNQDISGWDVSKVTDMSEMFYYAILFNQNLDSWNVSNVTDMEYMFYEADSFNGTIGSWDVNKVTTMESMFFGADAFNQPVGDWNVSNVTTMKQMFGSAITFNQPVGNWNVGNVRNMEKMFFNCFVFNQDISRWDVSSVQVMRQMFMAAQGFNQDISNWDVHMAYDMSFMFSYATAFDQNIGSWDIDSVYKMEFMFDDAELSTKCYDSLLIGWAKQTVESNVTFHAGSSRFSEAARESRERLIDEYEWIITDSGENAAVSRIATIADTTLIENFSPAVVTDLKNIFTDSDDAKLHYTATSLQGVVSPRTDENDSLFLDPLTDVYGVDTIIVTATDGGDDVADTFVVTVRHIPEITVLVDTTITNTWYGGSNLVDTTFAPNKDTVVTTYLTEIKYDSLSIRTDSLSDGVSYWDTTLFTMTWDTTFKDTSIDILKYIPTITVVFDTTHTIKKDTATTVTEAVQVNLDTLVTTTVTENWIDTMFVKTDSLSDGVIYWTIIDTSITSGSNVLSTQIDTLKYIPTITVAFDTTHTIKKDTATTVTEAVQVNLDTIITTTVTENWIDSMFIKTDSLSDDVVYWTTVDSSVTSGSSVLSTRIDTLKYIPTITVAIDTTHAIKRDTATTVTEAVQVNLDTIITTTVTESWIDSLFVQTDSLSDGMVYWTKIDTSVTSGSQVLSVVYDTLFWDKVAIKESTEKASGIGAFAVAPNIITDESEAHFVIGESLSGEGRIFVLDHLGDIIDEQIVSVEGGGHYFWDLTNSSGYLVTSGIYLVVLELDGKIYQRRIGIKR